VAASTTLGSYRSDRYPNNTSVIRSIDRPNGTGDLRSAGPGSSDRAEYTFIIPEAGNLITTAIIVLFHLVCCDIEPVVMAPPAGLSGASVCSRLPNTLIASRRVRSDQRRYLQNRRRPRGV
jgi:hypothetical protein